MRMKPRKTRIIPFWALLFALGILLGVAQSTSASLKRVIILERADVGFPTLIETLRQQKLRLTSHLEPKRRLRGLTAFYD